MPLYDMDAPVSVPGATLTTFRTECTNAAATIGHADLSDALTKLADVGLPVNNRLLASVTRTWMFAKQRGLTALRDAARAVLDQSSGIP